MQRHHFSQEVGQIDRLIAAISSEIESERATLSNQDGLLREMEDAIAELRLARGVRLLLQNAQAESLGSGAGRHSRVTGWPRTSRRLT